ncbi:MAG: hypothetical protein JW845_06110 [Dehalococcoidales bacterium]|nr:hypothetical protein [Dehalococcoidales bacterium]
MAVHGTYKIEIDTPMGKQEATLTLKADGDKLSGSMESSFGKMDFSGGTVTGDDVAWETEVSSPMGSMKLGYTGKVSGDDISGNVKAGDFGTSPFTGKRI